MAALLLAAGLGPAAAADIEWAWTGAVTPTTARVVVGLPDGSEALDLVYSTQPDLSEARRTSMSSVRGDPSPRTAVADLGALRPGTRYWFAAAAEQEAPEEAQGSFRTFELRPETIRVAFAACASTGSNHPVFRTIRERDPDLFIHTGDLHYEDIRRNEPGRFQAAFRRVLTSPSQQALYSHVPIAYMWDDHDYGPNNSDRTSPGRPAALLAYRQFVPHYPLAFAGGDDPVAQAWDLGRIRFVMTDLRSARDPARQENPSMLGAEQKLWLKRQLLQHRDRPLTVWISTVPWTAEPRRGADHWGGYVEERREIADFLKENRIGNVVILAGDAHMLAIDDGTNSDYADGGGAPIPIFVAAALDRRGSVKGGPYSHGTFPGRGQFGLMEIEDRGEQGVRVVWTGRNHENEVIVRHEFERP